MPSARSGNRRAQEVVASGHHEPMNVEAIDLAALTWLAHALSAHGQGLRAGEIINTGTRTELFNAEPGDDVRATFGALFDCGDCPAGQSVGDVDHHVVLLDGHWIRFRDVGALLKLQRLRGTPGFVSGDRFECDIVCPHAHPGGVEPGLPGADIELPAVPRATQDLAVAGQVVVAGPG